MRSKEHKNRQNLKKIWKHNLFAFRLVFRAAPLSTIIHLISYVLHAVLLFVEHTYMLAYIVDAILYGWPFRRVVIFVLVVLAVSIGNQILNIFFAYRIYPKAIEKVNREIRLMLYDKASQLDLAYYDDPEYYNDFVWAMGEAPSRIQAVMNSIGKLVEAVVSIIVVGGYLISTDWVGVGVALITVGCALFFQSRKSKRLFQRDSDIRPMQRKRDYINRLFYLSDYAKDLRMSELKEKLYRDFAQSNEDIEKEVKKQGRKIVILDLLWNYLCNHFLFDGVYLVYLLFMTIVQKVFSYGTMMALYNSAIRLKGNVQTLTQVISEFHQHSLYIEKVMVFLHTKSKIPDQGKAALPANGDLVLHNVSFAYTQGGEPVLKNIHLTVKKGEKIALVGYNGAGKSTLVKIMMRLYDPTSGEVFYDGRNIQEYPLEDYRKSFGTVFQNYQIFAATLGENIVMGPEPIDRHRAEEMMKKSGFYDFYATLKRGLDTPLTKEFDDDGINLSGGEAQKVAITRALYQDSPIIILDEPSSALDPLSEYRLNHTVRELAQDKTVVFISHRLSTTRMADKIYMLEKGRIIEQGTHDELMKMNGKYAQMFLLQAEKYR